MVGQSSALNPSIRQQEQIRDLQTELAELRAQLSKVRPASEGDGATTEAPRRNARGIPDSARGACEPETPSTIRPVQNAPVVVEVRSQADVSSTEIADPKERSPMGFYNRHSMFQFFGEVR